MNCASWEERIALYAGGDLDAVEAGEVEAHIGGCAGCQVFAKGLKQDLTAMQVMHAEPISAAHFAAVRARVLSEVGRRHAPGWRWTWGFGLVAAAALVLLLVWPRQPAPKVAAVAVLDHGLPVAVRQGEALGTLPDGRGSDEKLARSSPEARQAGRTRQAERTPAERARQGKAPVTLPHGRGSDGKRERIYQAARPHQAALVLSVTPVDAFTSEPSTVIKLETADPSVVIYWITEKTGE